VLIKEATFYMSNNCFWFLAVGPLELNEYHEIGGYGRGELK